MIVEVEVDGELIAVRVVDDKFMEGHKLYQIIVNGRQIDDLGWLKIGSQQIFWSIEQAAEYLPEFIRLCRQPRFDKDFMYIDNIKSVAIVALNLRE